VHKMANLLDNVPKVIAGQVGTAGQVVRVPEAVSTHHPPPETYSCTLAKRRLSFRRGEQIEQIEAHCDASSNRSNSPRQRLGASNRKLTNERQLPEIVIKKRPTTTKHVLWPLELSKNGQLFPDSSRGGSRLPVLEKRGFPGFPPLPCATPSRLKNCPNAILDSSSGARRVGFFF
jgi:hypothetical protein